MDDDQDWLEALAGRPRPGAAATTRAEAQLMRAALRSQLVSAPVPTAEQLQADAESLVERAEQQGLLRERSRWCPACLARWQQLLDRLTLARAGGLALASLALGVFVFQAVLPTLAPRTEDEAVRRAPADGIWLLRVADPQAQRDRLATQLAEAGVRASRYERLGRFGLEADLPKPLPAAVQRALQAFRVTPASDGSLRVEFELAPRPPAPAGIP